MIIAHSLVLIAYLDVKSSVFRLTSCVFTCIVCGKLHVEVL